MAHPARFTKKTIDFLAQAGQQTSIEWLAKHKAEHQSYLIEPLQALAEYLFENLGRIKETPRL